MILIDTSAWIDFFRSHSPLTSAVDEALANDHAALCGPVLTELRRGLRSQADRRRVLPLLETCHWLEQPTDLWAEAGDIGFMLARRGLTVKTLDLLVATYALAHGTALLTSDNDFQHMANAGLPIQLAG